MKKAKISLAYVLALMVLGILTTIIVIWIKSPGDPDVVIGSNGKLPKNPISAIETIVVGGLKQAVIIRGEDARKPILLFLHGGPGSPQFPFLKNIGLSLEREFVVAYWQQRGAGRSYFTDIPEKSMTVQQLISDAVEITNYLKKRFEKDKIHLMGHSWGTFLGVLLANQHADLYISYTGIAQMSQQYSSEKISLEWLKKTIKDSDNSADIHVIQSLSIPDSLADSKHWLSYLTKQRAFINKYGGGQKHGFPRTKAIEAYYTMLFCTPEYTIQNKINYLKGFDFSMHHLWDDVIQTDIKKRVDSLEIPIYLIHGLYDQQTPYKLAKSFFEQLKAPKKHLFSFQHSAHAPFLDEPEKFNRIITKIANRAF